MINCELIRVYFRFMEVNGGYCLFKFLRLDYLITMLHQRIWFLESIKDISHDQVFHWATFWLLRWLRYVKRQKHRRTRFLAMMSLEMSIWGWTIIAMFLFLFRIDCQAPRGLRPLPYHIGVNNLRIVVVIVRRAISLLDTFFRSTLSLHLPAS